MSTAETSRAREIDAPTCLLVCALDRDELGHVAVAFRRHIDGLKKSGLVVPPGIAQIAELSLELVSRQQAASGSVSRLGQPDDDLHEREFLSRRDIQRLVGSSLATVDRWISSGQLPSAKRGRTRRIARADLERFLSAT